jgi:chromosome segregation ATPase
MPEGERLIDLEHLEAQLQQVEEKFQEALSVIDQLKAAQEQLLSLPASVRRLQLQAKQARSLLDATQLELARLIKEAREAVQELKAQDEARWAELEQRFAQLEERQDQLARSQRRAEGLALAGVLLALMAAILAWLR